MILVSPIFLLLEEFIEYNNSLNLNADVVSALRVLVFNNCAPSLKGGGAERTFLVYCQILHDIGFDVYAVFPERFRHKADNNLRFKTQTFKDRLNISGYTLSVFQLSKVIKDIDPDIVHLLDGLTPTDLLMAIVNRISIKKPLFVDVIALYRNPVFNLMVRFQLPFYNLFNGIAVSNPNLRKILIRWLVKPSKLLQYNPLFIDIPVPFLNENRRVGETFNLMFIGVLDDSHSYKGLDILLKLIRHINRSNKWEHKIVLHIIGGGEKLQYYKSYAEKNNLNNVTFKGYVPSILDEFNRMDALILPSKRRGEGFGKVILEAVLHGLPVFVSKYAGGSYLVEHYKIGMVFDPYRIKKSEQTLYGFIHECSENNYNAYIRRFQQFILAERDKSLNSIKSMYKLALKREINGQDRLNNPDVP